MDASTFLATIFNGCKGVPVTASAEEGFQSRRWRRGETPPAGKTYFCISTVKDIPRARVLQRRTEDLVETRLVVLDDIGTKISLAIAAKFPAPSYKLESSILNFQWGYFFTAGVDPARAAALIEALAAAGYTDAGSKRADRIMRIPGSLNDKYAEPFHAVLREWHPERTWTLSEFALAFNVTPTDMSALPVGPPVGLEPGENDPVFDWLVQHGLVIAGPNPRGWYAVHCPWEAEHTGDVDHGTDYLPSRPGVFKCLHSHGGEKTTAALKEWVERQDPGAELGPIGREQLVDLGKKLGAALGLPPETVPSDVNQAAPPSSEGDLSRLWAALQGQAAQGTMFAATVRDETSLSPAEALAAILREVYLDPSLLPDYDTTSAGNAARGQTTTAARVHAVMNLIGMRARWNVMEAVVESSFDAAPGYRGSSDKTDAGSDTLVHACARCGMKSTKAILQSLVNRALAKPYSPVCEWILSAPWDGKNRLEEVYRTLTMQDSSAESERWKRVAVRRWLLQGAAAMWNWQLDAAAVDVGYMLILQGKTGLGKSKWIERLLPVPWVSIGKSLRLDSPNERDVVSRVTHTPITEIGELDGSFKKSDDAALKNFLTTTIDIYRPPYGARDIARPRGTIFGASVNPTGFLKDMTGERRYWPLAVKAVDFVALEAIDRQQLWAEVKTLRDAGEPYWLQVEESVLHQRFAVEHRIETDVSLAVEDIVMRREAFFDRKLWAIVNVKELAQHYGLKSFPSLYSDLNAGLAREGFERERTKIKRGWLLPPVTQMLTPAQQAGFRLIKEGAGRVTLSEDKPNEIKGG